MVVETILQNDVLVRFAYPFLLIFILLFSVLKKTKIFGDNAQIDALLSFVIGLILVSAVQPKLVISNLMLFLSVAIVVVFVGLLIWGFLMGPKSLEMVEGMGSGLKWFFGILIFASVAIAVVWASGMHNQLINILFYQSWSNSFWTNFIFVALVIGALVFILMTAGKAAKGS
jgi:hypothetical protein